MAHTHSWHPYPDPIYRGPVTTACSACENKARGYSTLTREDRKAQIRALPKVEATQWCDGCRLYRGTCPACGYDQKWGYM